MHSPCKRPTPTYDFLLGVVSTIALPLAVFRVLVAAAVTPTPSPVFNASTSIAAALSVPAAFGLAWRRSVLRALAERADLIQRLDGLEKRVAEAEDAAWWGTPQEAEAERAVEADPTVLPFRHRRSS